MVESIFAPNNNTKAPKDSANKRAFPSNNLLPIVAMAGLIR